MDRIDATSSVIAEFDICCCKIFVSALIIVKMVLENQNITQLQQTKPSTIVSIKSNEHSETCRLEYEFPHLLDSTFMPISIEWQYFGCRLLHNKFCLSKQTI